MYCKNILLPKDSPLSSLCSKFLTNFLDQLIIFDIVSRNLKYFPKPLLTSKKANCFENVIKTE